MPLFYTHIINDSTRLAIWQIAEEEAFYLSYVPLSREISHPHKRLQHLAGRFLLQYLFPDFPIHLIQVADTRKPYLASESHHFSISHCGQYAAAIVSSSHRVGIDIEIPSAKINNIRHKFLSEPDMQTLSRHGLKVKLEPDKPLTADLFYTETIAWSAKESIFKWYGLGKVDFKAHMQLESIDASVEPGLITAFFRKEAEMLLEPRFVVFDGLVLSWVVTLK